MAMRRSYGSHERELDADVLEDGGGQPVGTDVVDLGAILGQPSAFDGGDAGMPTTDPYDRTNPEARMPDMGPASDDTGNRERPREVFGAEQPRTPVGAMPLDEIMALLPQGVEAQPGGEGQPGAEAMGMGAGSVPGLPMEPTTTVQRQQPPAMAQGEAGMGAGGPRRNTFESPSALFAGGGQQALGRQGGGGFSLPGQTPGPPQATKQMLELLRQLQGVGV